MENAQSESDGDVDRYLVLADRFRVELYGSDADALVRRIDQEMEHIREGLRQAVAKQRPEDIERGLRIAGGLRDYWWKRGTLAEGRHWLLRLLALSRTSPPMDARAQALDDAAVLAFYQTDYDEAILLLQESIGVRRELGNLESVVDSLLHLASMYRVGKADTAWAKAANEEALAVARELGLEQGIGYALSALGRVAIDEEDWPAAHSRLTESLSVLQRLGDTWASTIVIRHCALLAAATGRPRRALRLAAASAASHERLGMTSVPADQDLTDSLLARARAALPLPWPRPRGRRGER